MLLRCLFFNAYNKRFYIQMNYVSSCWGLNLVHRAEKVENLQYNEDTLYCEMSIGVFYVRNGWLVYSFGDRLLLRHDYDSQLLPV